jgi:hypothetical protein
METLIFSRVNQSKKGVPDEATVPDEALVFQAVVR